MSTKKAANWERNTSAAHLAKKKKLDRQWAELKFPKTPRINSAKDYLKKVIRPAIESLPQGGTSRIADLFKTDPSTIRKWTTAQRLPSQAVLDDFIRWHVAGALMPGAKPLEPKPKAPTPDRALSTIRPFQLGKLSPLISKRLSQTAKRKNITEVQLAEQLLDRHLPPLID